VPEPGREPGRRPLKPLPGELDGAVREFAEQLRSLYWERSELNQRELAAALHLTKSPVSRYLNGQEVMPAATLDALCEVLGLSGRERQRLGKLRERAAEEAEGAKPGAGAKSGTEPGTGASGRPRTPAARLRSPAALALAATAVALAAAGTALFTATGSSEDDPAQPAAGDPSPSPSCRVTRVYRVIAEGNLLDGRRNDIGDVHAGDRFLVDPAQPSSPYRFRDYGHVEGDRTKGYADQAKLKVLGNRCVR
jgi:hypothetical protein